MKKLHFTTKINAPVDKVWHVMLDDPTYREWTSAFMPGSYFEGDWSLDSEMKFLGPEEDGTLSGMLGKVVENTPNKFLSIEYRGQMIKGVEDTTSEEAMTWIGSHENYTFEEVDGGTQVTVDIETADHMADMFNGMWPKALENLKRIAEKE